MHLFDRVDRFVTTSLLQLLPLFCPPDDVIQVQMSNTRIMVSVQRPHTWAYSTHSYIPWIHTSISPTMSAGFFVIISEMQPPLPSPCIYSIMPAVSLVNITATPSPIRAPRISSDESTVRQQLSLEFGHLLQRLFHRHRRIWHRRLHISWPPCRIDLIL